jgi:hypothetical protein
MRIVSTMMTAAASMGKLRNNLHRGLALVDKKLGLY